jgi:hypothetical protein
MFFFNVLGCWFPRVESWWLLIGGGMMMMIVCLQRKRVEVVERATKGGVLVVGVKSHHSKRWRGKGKEEGRCIYIGKGRENLCPWWLVGREVYIWRGGSRSRGKKLWRWVQETWS